MPAHIHLLPEHARYRAREVRYFGGFWSQLKEIIPNFEVRDFAAFPNAPANPHLLTMVRLPLTPTEQPMPVGVVSPAYSLVQHREIGELAIECLRRLDFNVDRLHCEVGLSIFGEWMNLRVHLGHEFNLTPADGHPVSLRLEIFNSVDGSSRLVMMMSWLRLICSNGLTVRDTLTQLGDVHNRHLDLRKLGAGIAKDHWPVRQTPPKLEKNRRNLPFIASALPLMFAIVRPQPGDSGGHLGGHFELLERRGPQMALTDTTIRNAKPQAKPYKLTDEKGLFLLVQPSGGKLWRFKFRVDGRDEQGEPKRIEKKVGLGTYPDVSLKDARRLRDEARASLAAGVDPAEKKRRDAYTAKVSAANSFEAVARAYIDKCTREGRSERTTAKQEWLLKLLDRTIGQRPVAEIQPFEMLEAVRKYETTGRTEAGTTSPKHPYPN